MTAEDWKFVSQVFGSLGIGAVAGGAVVYLFLKTYASSYLWEKGKNLATKEDIEKITRTVEEVKSELQAQHTLRFAAIERRLQAHQEAFGLCWKLLMVAPEREELEKVLDACMEWYGSNSLYLEPGAQDAFWRAHKVAANLWSNTGSEAVDGSRRDIMASLTEIAKAVGLPPLRGDEGLPLSTNTKRASKN